MTSYARIICAIQHLFIAADVALQDTHAELTASGAPASVLSCYLSSCCEHAYQQLTQLVHSQLNLTVAS